MKQALYVGAGKIRIETKEAPAPGPGEVRLRVGFVGICGTDLHIFHGRMDGRVRPPKTVGHEMSGTIDAVGADVTGWAPGDRVTVRPLRSCGTCAACVAGHGHVCMNLDFVGIDSPGAFQEFWNVPAALLHRLPEGLDLKHGALMEPLAVACHDVRRGRVQAGEKAVVLGAGPIGILVALVARARGAEVAVVERDEGRRAFAGSLGFHAMPPGEDLVRSVHHWSGGAGADVVFECTGAPACAHVMTHLARVRGRVVVVGIFTEPPPVDLKQVFWRELEIIGARVYEPVDFEGAIALGAGGTLPLDRLITGIHPLVDLERAFQSSTAGMKTLVACGD